MFLPFLSLIPIFIAVFLFSLWRPKAAIFLPLVFHVSFLVKTKIFFVPSTGLELLIIGVLLGVWIAEHYQILAFVGAGLRARPRTMFVWEYAEVLPYIVPGALILLFVISSTVSALIAPHSTTAWGAWKALIVEPILYALTLILVVKRYNLGNWLIASLLGGGVVSCLSSLVFWRFGADFWRFRGIYDVPNSLALILAPLLVVAVLYYLTRFTEKSSFLQKQESATTDSCCRRNDVVFRFFRSRRWLLIFTICVFSILLIATQSIAGIVSVGVALMFIFFIKKRLSRRVMVGLFLMALLAIGTQTFSGKIPHLLNRTSSSFIAREQIWTVALALIKDHVLLGTGLGTFEPAYQEKLKTLNTNFGTSGVLEWVVRDPHNIFLSFWLNTGLLGLLSIAGLVFMGAMSFLRKQESDKRQTDPCFSRDDTTTNQYRMLAGAAMLTLVIFGLFDVPYWKNDLAVLWWVYLAASIL